MKSTKTNWLPGFLQFCATRKGAVQAANTLLKEAKFVFNSQHKQRLLAYSNSMKDSKLRGARCIHLTHSISVQSSHLCLSDLNMLVFYVFPSLVILLFYYHDTVLMACILHWVFSAYSDTPIIKKM